MTAIPLTDDPVRPPYGGPRLQERALAAINFSPVFKIANSDTDMAVFQDRIRGDYPYARRDIDRALRINVQDDGSFQNESVEQAVWRFQDKNRNSTVTLTPEGVALDILTAGYATWSEFIAQLGRLLAHVKECYSPEIIQRTGVRYLNTGSTSDGTDPRSFCHASLSSITGNSQLELADLFWKFVAKEGDLLLRSGVMPPNSTYDPGFFAPRDYSCWYLDIDVVHTGERHFDVDGILSELLEQARRVHAVYYWAVPEFSEARL